MSYYRSWPAYVSVAEKRKKAEAAFKKLQKKGKKLSPIYIQGLKIANTFWGKAWCDHLESYSDYSNRLPRGKSYVRNGYVVHLGIKPGEIEAKVQGSSLYKVKISIKEASKQKWESVVKACSGKIDSVFELLQGKLSKSVMEIITDKHEGLFPQPKEIDLNCSCPDRALMCKHVAAVMYGVGSRLDKEPELLFLLRNVDQSDLISKATSFSVTQQSPVVAAKSKSKVSDQALQDIFGIEIDSSKSIDSMKKKSKLSIKLKNTPSILKKKSKTDKKRLK